MMNYNPFDDLAADYERWFVENNIIFQTELLALKQAIPPWKTGVEIGIGSGIFAEKLGVRYGIDPSESMLGYARKRGLDVQKGIAENLPYDSESFDFAMFITALCFVNNPEQAINEAYRILKINGEVIVAIIDRETRFGEFLEKGKEKSRFYKYAQFYSAPEIVNLLERHNFKMSAIIQTLADPATFSVESPEEGYGKGSFVVVKAVKA